MKQNQRDREEAKQKEKRETTLIHGSTKRTIEWRAGPYPKENAIQTSSSLNAFAGENSMSVYEIGCTALDTSQAKIVELERVLNTQRDDITTEFEKEARIAENIHKEEMEKVLQIQKDEMNAKFEKRVHTTENLHREELDALKLEHSKK
jgi:hypothetical protein